MKKLTVRGIIGKTQGVSNAAKPAKRDIKNIMLLDMPSLFDSVSTMLLFSCGFTSGTLFSSIFV
jgi:hypothetical protein